jgi:osmotically-inducible protein OsmY
MRLRTIIAAGMAGAGLAYFFDPESGRRRRAQARDRISAAARRGGRSAAQRAQLMAEQSAAAPAAAVSAAGPAPRYDDATLADRVMTELFADSDLKARVNVSAQNGVVVLVGEVEDPDAVVRRVKKVKGVGSVESLLHRPGTPAPHLA